MHFMRSIFLLFFMMILSLAFAQSRAEAATLYRHLPFSASIQPGDKIITNYDFQGRTGVDCQANNNNVRIDFQYKGHQKSDFLPIHLQSSHVPNNESEVLSNVDGQFTLSVNEKNTSANRIKIHCSYVN